MDLFKTVQLLLMKICVQRWITQIEVNPLFSPLLLGAFDELKSPLTFLSTLYECMHTRLAYYQQPFPVYQTVEIYAVHSNLQTIQCLCLAPLPHSVTVHEITGTQEGDLNTLWQEKQDRQL